MSTMTEKSVASSVGSHMSAPCTVMIGGFDKGTLSGEGKPVQDALVEENEDGGKDQEALPLRERLCMKIIAERRKTSREIDEIATEIMGSSRPTAAVLSRCKKLNEKMRRLKAVEDVLVMSGFGKKANEAKSLVTEGPSPEKRRKKVTPKATRRGSLLAGGGLLGGFGNSSMSALIPGTPKGNRNVNNLAVPEYSIKNRSDPNIRKAPRCAPELLNLAVYTKKGKFVSFEHSRQCGQPNEIPSFAEKKARKLAKSSPSDFVEYHSRMMSRVYPDGLRIYSSNFDPQQFWNVGCQLVALNYQTPGRPMELNKGRFLANGECGYVLKPACMRRGPDYIVGFDISADTTVLQGQGMRVHNVVVHVLMGQRLQATDGIEHLVEVELVGLKADAKKERSELRGGSCPVYDCQIVFPVHLPELALLRFVLLQRSRDKGKKDGKETAVGSYTLPITSMQPGFRHVPLYKLSSFGKVELLPSFLLVYVCVGEE